MNPETTPERGEGHLDDTKSTTKDETTERWRRTAIAAFYRAEARGFEPGRELEDWLAAEHEVDAAASDHTVGDAPPTLASDQRREPQSEQVKQPSTRKQSAAKSASRSRKTTRSMGTDIGGMA